MFSYRRKGGDFFMFEFEIIQELEPNTEILEIIKNYNYTI